MIEAIIVKWATHFGVDINLVKAITEIESHFNPYCMRYEPQVFNQYHATPMVVDDANIISKKLSISFETEMVLRASSLGPMQVLGQVARELGHKSGLLDLCNPEVGIMLGVMKLKQLVDRHAGFEDYVIVSYNAGTPRKLSDGNYVPAQQNYLNKVKSALKKYRELAAMDQKASAAPSVQ